MAGISTYGERGLSGILGFENNELHRKIYIKDPQNDLDTVLQKLFGNPGDTPLAFPAPFDSFFAWSVNFELADERGAIGESEEDIDTALDDLDSFPTIKGGMILDITFRPLDTQGQPVSDEGWDFSAHTMSLIGNNYGQNPQSLTWSDGTAITNITAIVKIIPKIEFVQTQVFQANTPGDPQVSLIGSVNDGDLLAGAEQPDGTRQIWPTGTVLLTGLPVVRRWRWDGMANFQWGCKLAINTYQDTLEDMSNGFVTWNRLYRPEKGYWDKVLVGPGGDPLYPEDDLSQVVA